MKHKTKPGTYVKPNPETLEYWRTRAARTGRPLACELGFFLDEATRPLLNGAEHERREWEEGELIATARSAREGAAPPLVGQGSAVPGQPLPYPEHEEDEEYHYPLPEIRSS